MPGIIMPLAVSGNDTFLAYSSNLRFSLRLAYLFRLSFRIQDVLADMACPFDEMIILLSLKIQQDRGMSHSSRLCSIRIESLTPSLGSVDVDQYWRTSLPCLLGD